ncbi:MAG: RtcB family protein [Thermoplasmatota archaeon]
MSWAGPLHQVADAIHEIPQTYKGTEGNLNMRVPGRIIASPELLGHIADDLAPEQVANVATLPGIVGHSLAMPDIHWGYGFPIGGVAAFDPDEEGIVSPGGVGFDINCGVRLLKTDLTVDQVRPRLKETVDGLFEAVPAGMGSRGGTQINDNDLQDVLAEGAGWAVENGIAEKRDRLCMEEGGRLPGASSEHVGERALLRGRRSLGSLGSGNHFLELQYVDETWNDDALRAYGITPGQVVIMVHTGSRGLGHQVCQDFVQSLQSAAKKYNIDLPDRQLACAPLTSPEGEAYLSAMAAAANFGFVNRSYVTHFAREAMEKMWPGVDMEVLYDVGHNIAKWEEHTIPGTQTKKRVCVHRKGAIRSFGPGSSDLAPQFQDAGQPVIVPGDMGRQSFLLAGATGAMEQSFGSSCHGAGRRLSRTAAKKQYDGADLIRHLWEEKGIHVRAVSHNIAAEEAPGAYKDVSQVVDSVEQAGLARKVARLKPLGVVKG